MQLVSEEVAGNPSGTQRWIRRSLRQLQQALATQGLTSSYATIRRLLLKHDIRPRRNIKRLTPTPHRDRDRQFRYIQRQRAHFRHAGWPIISVDTKKTELIGPFRQAGRVWAAQATAVYTHDFPSDARGKAIPYGVYDVGRNRGYVYVGHSANTPAFAVTAIARWWAEHGRTDYPAGAELLILADGGGSNSYRARCWKQQLQVQLADRWQVPVTVCHYPRGASKWNPIEHRLFSRISATWGGTPLTSMAVVLAGLRATATTTGLQVEATLLRQKFPTGVRVSDAEMATLTIEQHRTCPAWNYTIHPRETGK